MLRKKTQYHNILIKTQIFDKKQQRNLCKQKIVIFYSELAPLTRDVTDSNLWCYGEHIGDKKLLVEHTSIVPTFKYT